MPHLISRQCTQCVVIAPESATIPRSPNRIQGAASGSISSLPWTLTRGRASKPKSSGERIKAMTRATRHKETGDLDQPDKRQLVALARSKTACAAKLPRCRSPLLLGGLLLPHTSAPLPLASTGSRSPFHTSNHHRTVLASTSNITVHSPPSPQAFLGTTGSPLPHHLFIAALYHLLSLFFSFDDGPRPAEQAAALYG